MNPVIAEWLTRPGGIVERLRALRSRSGLRHRELADKLGWAPSKVSKLENGKQLPTAADLRGWVSANDGSEAEATALVELLGQVDQVRLDWANRLAKDEAEQVQVNHAALAADATVIRNYEPALVPGLLQLAAYTRSVLTTGFDLLGADPAGIDGMVRGRQERQTVLYEPGKAFEFIVTEPALRWRVAPPDVMRAQLRRLLEVMNGEAIRFGVIPLSAQLHTIQFAGFIIYGDWLVTEDFAGERQLPADSEAHRTHSAAMDRLWADAVEGDDARQLIAQAIDSLRQ